MSLIELFFTQTATIKPFSHMGNGEPVYGEEETRRCRMERGKNLRAIGTGANGDIEEIAAHARMFCVGEQIPSRSKVTCDGQEFTVINCAVMNGFADNHLEVYLE